MSKWEKQGYCSDCGKRKRYVNEKKQVYYCFVCCRGGKLTTGTEPMVGLELDETKGPVESQEVPPSHRPLSDFDRNYYSKRGVSPRLIQLLGDGLHSTDTGLLFMFPTEDYWQERRWGAFRPPPWKFPKNAKRITKDGVGFHIKINSDSKRVTVVEGIFDALRVSSLGYNSFAILSKKVHEAQAMELARGYDSCSLLLDSDVSLRDFNEAISVLAVHMDVEGIILTEGDPAEQTDEDLKELLND